MNRTEFLELIDKNTKESKVNYHANACATSLLLDINRNLPEDLKYTPEYGHSMYNEFLKKIVQSQYDLIKDTLKYI